MIEPANYMLETDATLILVHSDSLIWLLLLLISLLTLLLLPLFNLFLLSDNHKGAANNLTYAAALLGDRSSHVRHAYCEEAPSHAVAIDLPLPGLLYLLDGHRCKRRQRGGAKLINSD